MKFIDLFAGIGGFHIALKELGHECVFASELSPELRTLYAENHGIECHGDITKVDHQSIPSHDILCAGFPCQSFSKAGNQNGMQEARGKLFSEIINILTVHRPKYFILENVRNLEKHDQGKTWEHISEELHKLDYFFDKKILSPHFINIPQHRERVFIVGSLDKKDIDGMEWVEKEEYSTSVESILSYNNTDENLINEKKQVLAIWQIFLNDLPDDVDPYLPLWSMEFNADYPIDTNWESISLAEWRKYKGNYGYPLLNCKNIEEIFNHLPNYVRTQKNKPPTWKQRFIRNNREFYKNYRKFINPSTIDVIQNFKQESWKKLEWNCKGENKILSDKLIQFRGSGIRIKRIDYIPSLVTVKSQIPIIGKFMRSLLPEEGARAQSLPDHIKLPETNGAAFRVLGNMVNVELVYRVASSLLSNINKKERKKKKVLEEVLA